MIWNLPSCFLLLLLLLAMINTQIKFIVHSWQTIRLELARFFLPNPLEDSRSRRLFAGFIVRTSLGLFFYPLRKKKAEKLFAKTFLYCNSRQELEKTYWTFLTFIYTLKFFKIRQANKNSCSNRQKNLRTNISTNSIQNFGNGTMTNRKETQMVLILIFIWG